MANGDENLQDIGPFNHAPAPPLSTPYHVSSSNDAGFFDMGFDPLPQFPNQAMNGNQISLGQNTDFDNALTMGIESDPFDGSLVGASEPALESPSTKTNTKFPTKIGARFSIETVSVLRKWFTANKDNPYPTEMDKETLQSQTGLSRTQIMNWISNARRRTLLQPSPRSSWWHEDISATRPIHVPPRPGTPAFRASSRSLNPMERWVDSPPEHEPATVTDIARAIGADPFSIDNPQTALLSGYGSDRSANDLYAHSSRNTSHSSGSSISDAYSHSHGSSGSCRTPNSLSRSHSRRKKRTARRRITGKTSLAVVDNRFQCTFCTETFKTKYDWKRHEKSLHMPLEQWFCSPEGPKVVRKEDGQSICAFCGQLNPTEAHIEFHNPSFCQERAFSRKDHLKQHLKLVHNATLNESLTKHWKAPVPQIRSRCGFCGLTLDTWDIRADHLSDHFKMGKSMADWEGDWGFDAAVSKMVENAIEPFLVDLERHTPAPFRAGVNPTEGPRHAYELIHSELSWFLQTHNYDLTGLPNNETMQLEACRVIVAAETMMTSENAVEITASSWLRDLITANNNLMQQARFGPIRGKGESALSSAKLDCKESLFEGCPLESQLQDYVRYQWTTNQRVLSDNELQETACGIIAHIGHESAFIQNNMVTDWLLNLIRSSTDWLVDFRRRALDFTLDTNLAPLFTGNYSELQEESTQTENPLFGLPPASFHRSLGGPLTPADRTASPVSPIWDPMTYSPQSAGFRDRGGEADHRPPWVKTSLAYFNDSNFYKWLARDLGRWVVATMSPNNPNCHTPSDEELRHQARCILYNDDDPWNPTAADNAEWLRRFKKDFNIE